MLAQLLDRWRHIVLIAASGFEDLKVHRLWFATALGTRDVYLVLFLKPITKYVA
jgi:hypothetical protein